MQRCAFRVILPSCVTVAPVSNDEISEQPKNENAPHPAVQRPVDDNSGGEHGRDRQGRAVPAKRDRVNDQRHDQRCYTEDQQNVGNVRSNDIANRDTRIAAESRL